MISINKKHLQLFVAFVLFSFASTTLHAQKRNASYVEYIEQYHALAVKHMKQYKIPASITLAQGILESGAGKSELARTSKNHFGIKCHSNWEGQRVFRADDGPNDCFRVYSSVNDSYEDHSKFIAERSRYAELFTYDITDYKKWAKGLQKCGYATDKGYANKLIKVIEDYELYHYDGGKYIVSPTTKDDLKPKSTEPTSVVVSSGPLEKTAILKKQGLVYIHAKESENLAQVAQRTGRKLSDLQKYNEMTEDFPLQPGDIVYLQKKKSKADKPNFDHVVQVGESMHSISQLYGIQLSSLYKLNKKSRDYVPEEGDVLRLR